MHAATSPTRQGFTLIEMLAVMGIMLMLFAIGVAFLPGMYQRNDVTQNAAAVQRLLVKARTEARTYGKVTGVMLNPGSPATPIPTTATLAIGQYPDDMLGSGATGAQNGLQVTLPAAGPFPQFNDVLVFDNIGVPHLVSGFAGTQATLASPLANNLVGNNYRIIRQTPIAEAGGEQVQLLNGGIDVSKSSVDGQTAVGTNYSWLFPGLFFSPAGSLVNAPGNFISLFIPDPNGPGLLVVVYSRTGVVAIQPVDPTLGGNPYNYANDPRPSGL